ncbi:uncharacterized protein LOC115620046 [Scaptodrosophila lebanonensis]|uniref:Uncharacterized protein LOC115620046 n=1 Tax=Drosophila lebanonensis TaxID=7225 RepID=A0A6J2T293_DROLE|nr:uncharacterized protein LOC115620046 [Scaptodrosophila lebanonensis]XP_030369027.1 uncharacterized protein LOC115620046 [Scaptodrosophila lebanonensis]
MPIITATTTATSGGIVAAAARSGAIAKAVVGLDIGSAETANLTPTPPATATTAVTSDYLLLQQQQQQFNHHYYQHHQQQQQLAAPQTMLNAAHQHPVNAGAAAVAVSSAPTAATAVATATENPTAAADVPITSATATSFATFNGNSNLNSNLANGSNHSSSKNLNCNNNVNDNGCDVAGNTSSIRLGPPPPPPATKKSMAEHASREDVASLGGTSSVNSQMSAHNHFIGNTNNNNSASSNIGIGINGLPLHINHNHINNANSNGAPARPTGHPSSILKGSKENLLQNTYYNGEGGESSLGSECGGMDNHNHSHATASHEDPGDGLGPLPPKWETAYTERGELYFIDHNTGTSHWLDPRLSKYQKKSLEDCCEDELPYGWEKIEDSLYGTYFIDHVNRRTQYENPVLEAKRRAAEQRQLLQQQEQQDQQLQQQRAKTPTTTQLVQDPVAALDAATEATPKTLLPYKFTRNPAELQGQRISTTLLKSARGLGITIVGGDGGSNPNDGGVEEFLQIKTVVPNGPAWLDGQLQTGDVLVYVNDTCVLGFTHHDMVSIFQSILPGETATLEVCRGYPLPFDPNDPNTEVVTTIAVDGITSESEKQRRMIMDLNMDGNYNFLDLSGDGTSKGAGSGFILMKKPEIHTFSIIKGTMGFGFTIADSACGQKVKKILDRNCCTQLQEGDVLLEINDINVRNKSHVYVVEVLKECSKTAPTTVKIQRVPNEEVPVVSQSQSGNGGNSFGNVAKLRKNFVGGTATTGGGLFRSKTPTADLYSTQPKEVLPMRPKTPLVDTRRARVQTPNELLETDGPLATLAESKTHVDGKSNNSLQELDEIPFMDPYPKMVSRLSERLAEASLQSDNNGYSTAPTHFTSQEQYVSPNYNPIYGLTALPPSMQPLPQNAAATTGAPAPTHLYGPLTTPLGLMTPNSTANTGAVYGQTQHHHDSCYCYDCQNLKFRPQHVSPLGYFAPQPLPSSASTAQYSPLQAAHIQNERMQRRVNELLSDRRRVGFANLDPPLHQHQQPQQDHQHHHQQLPHQHSPAATSWLAGGTRNGALLDASEDADQCELTEVTLERQALGFGFRIVGGTEEGSQVTVGHIVPGGAADQDQRIATGDEILSIDGINVLNSSHHKVVSLVGESALRGQVTMILRRRRTQQHATLTQLRRYPYDVIVSRHENEGFGFVIISSSNHYYGSTIGKLIPASPADRCGELKVGDRIIAVNRIDIAGMSHGDVVNLIKESGLHVRLTIGCPIKEGPSPSGNSGLGSNTPLQASPSLLKSAQSQLPPQQQQQQQHHHQPQQLDMIGGYIERPGTSMTTLSLHQQPQL